MEIHKSSGFAAVPYNNLYRHLVYLCLASKQKKRPNSDRHLGKVLRLFKLLVYSQYDFHIGGWYSSASEIEKKEGKEISHLATGSNCQHAVFCWEASTCQQNSHFFPKRDDSLFTVQFAMWEKYKFQPLVAPTCFSQIIQTWKKLIFYQSAILTSIFKIINWTGNYIIYLLYLAW